MFADSAPTMEDLSAAAAPPAGSRADTVPVATAPTAAADAMTEVRSDGPEGGGLPAIRWRAGTIVELRSARRPRGERCPATNLTFQRWGAIRSEREVRSGVR